ncbi:MAG: hypothetical protein ACREEB_17485, partial [Caulobacteraceae bacterium]
MRKGGAWREIGRRAACLMAFVALALLVVVPPGFMIGGQSDGRTRIVICTGHGPVDSIVDLGGKGAPARGKKSGMTCPFAAHAAPSTPAPAAPATAIASTSIPAPLATPASHVAIGRGLAAPPPARG